MALPITKQELADWILRRLGAPVVNVEITDVQLEDVIDEAVQFFQEFHYDGAERTYRTIKIEGDVLSGNNRQTHDINAAVYSADSDYFIGDRVSLWHNDKMVSIWVKVDSDIKYWHRTYTENDSDGMFFLLDSDLAEADFNQIFDSENPGSMDSDGKFVLYDSDIHSTLQGTRFDLTLTRFVDKNLTFEEAFRKEDLILNEPNVNYDYSKTGQVGIPLPENIIGVSKVFRIDNFSGMGMWNYEYQYFLNNFDFFYGNGGASSGALTNYYVTKSYIDLIDNMMNLQPAIRFSKHRNRLYIDTNWSRLEKMASSKDYYLMMECYEVNDPEVYGDVYKDKWLKRYATALAKEQWGSNLKKYTNTDLPGGIQVDGQKLYDEGKEERLTLEEELKNSQLEMDSILIG